MLLYAGRDNGMLPTNMMHANLGGRIMSCYAMPADLGVASVLSVSQCLLAVAAALRVELRRRECLLVRDRTDGVAMGCAPEAEDQGAAFKAPCRSLGSPTTRSSASSDQACALDAPA